MKRLFMLILLPILLGACNAPVADTIVATPMLKQTTMQAPPPPDLEDLPEAVPSPTEAPTEQPDASEMPDPGSATWTLLAGDFRRPVLVTHAGDERLFVVEQEGVIWVLQGGQRNPEPFLDIRQRVNSRANEQGLLGLAFHPDYQENGALYVNYTGAGGDTIISRFQRSEDPNRADADSETIVLSFTQPYGNHNGGALVFGPDGFLYIGTGDGGSGGDPLGNGQRTDTLLGKILRLDVTTAQPYAIPPDNPFAQGGGSPEIWALGLRNPWRIAFDSKSGDLYIGDVGQNQWEEVNHQPANSPGGENYGWNLREGAHTYAAGQAAWVDPVAEYDHSLGCSVTGGEVVRDPRLSTWSGVYLYGDYCSGRIWGLVAGDQGWSSQLLFKVAARVSSFGQDSLGRVYMVDHNGGIYRLDPAP